MATPRLDLLVDVSKLSPAGFPKRYRLIGAGELWNERGHMVGKIRLNPGRIIYISPNGKETVFNIPI